MISQTSSNSKRVARHLRIRQTLSGTASKPRLNVFRSNKAIYVQIINDETGTTLCSASSLDKDLNCSGTKVEQAALVGSAIAKKALALNIETVVFDRGGYLYHGRVKALAEAARAAGLKF